MIEKEELLTIIPHRGSMLLLSRVIGYNLEEKVIEAEYDITAGCIFYDSVIGGVPGWAGFEFIAQAIGALAGIRSRERGEKPKMGFILSVSSLKIGIPFFTVGSTAEIKTKEIERMDSVYTFEGEVFLEGKKVIEGKLTVMEVDDEQARAIKEGTA